MPKARTIGSIHQPDCGQPVPFRRDDSWSQIVGSEQARPRWPPDANHPGSRLRSVLRDSLQQLAVSADARR